MTDQYKVVTAGQVLETNRDLPPQFIKTADQDRLDAITVIQGMTDAERTAIMGDFGYQTLADFDQYLEQEEEWRLRDRLDWYTYDDKTVQFTAKDGAWFLPEAVESFCAEEIGNEATKSIDGLNSTFWQDLTNHQHSIVYRLRGYPKKISKIRWRYGGSAARERLNDIDISASRGLLKIDDANNILDTGINPTWPAGPAVWVEHDLTVAGKKSNKCRYLKMSVGNTDNVNNQLQLREFQVWVETRQPGDKIRE